MQEIPHLARLAAMIGDRARAQILSTLMSGRAFTATELANVAEVSRATVSSHLAQLQGAGLIAVQSAGRHRYFRLPNAEVAHLLETLMGVANRVVAEPRFGPRDAALRRARLCYDHLAGEFAVGIFASLEAQGAFAFAGGNLTLNEIGWSVISKLNIAPTDLSGTSRSACRACLDWSERRNHLAGAIGALLLKRFLDLGWANTSRGSRVVHFSATSERALRKAFGMV